MLIKQRSHNKGFTLIEMLLVLVIASMIIFMATGYIQEKTLASRIDRASLQMQQILNASLSYYVTNGFWPTSLACLQGSGGAGCTLAYLPPATILNPWGQTYTIVAPTSGGTPPNIMYVYSSVTAGTGSTSGVATAAANIITGKLPLAYTTSKNGNPPPPPSSGGAACTNATTKCYVVASVNIPGQNLNNAPSVNFAGVYRHGGCVPVPSCPVDSKGNTMTAEIVVVPVSVSGVNDANSNNLYPITSFTGYAKGPAANPAACTGGTAVNCQAQNPVANATYWRACMQVVTSKGDVSKTNTGGFNSNSFPKSYPWGGNVSLMAITRCAIKNEPSGSTLNVFSQ